MTPAILVFAGSTRRDSLNKKLAASAARAAARQGAAVTLLDLADYPLPLYDGDLEKEQGVPESARALAFVIAQHDGLVIASPEYNGSFSPLLKNTIDWTTRVDRKLFADKVVALMSATPGKGGGARGLAVVRQTLENMRVEAIDEQITLAGAAQAFDETGGLPEPRRQELEQVVARLVDAVVGRNALASTA